MSVQAMSRVMAKSEASGISRLVLLVMANRAGGDDDVCFASVERVAFECRVHPRTVQRSIHTLVAAGDLLPQGIHEVFHTNTYRVMHRVAESHRGSSGPVLPPERKELDLGLGVVEVPTDPHPTSKAATADSNPNQPTHDQIDLARKLGETWGQVLGVPAIVKLNRDHGRLNVENALRSLRGFPPEEAVRKLYAYVGQIAADNAEAQSA